MKNELNFDGRVKNEEIYDWKWVLAREKDGEWTVIASGLD